MKNAFNSEYLPMLCGILWHTMLERLHEMIRNVSPGSEQSWTESTHSLRLRSGAPELDRIQVR